MKDKKNIECNRKFSLIDAKKQKTERGNLRSYTSKKWKDKTKSTLTMKDKTMKSQG